MQSLIALPSSIAVVQRLNNCLVLELRWKPRGIVHHSLFFVEERERENKKKEKPLKSQFLGPTSPRQESRTLDPGNERMIQPNLNQLPFYCFGFKKEGEK